MTMTNGGDQTAQLTVLGTGRLPQPEGGPRAGLWKCSPTGSRIARMSSAWRFPNTRPCAP